jgi:hypothetical protein
VKKKVLYLQAWKIYPLQNRFLLHVYVCRLVSCGLRCHVVLWLVTRLQGITSQETAVFIYHIGTAARTSYLTGMRILPSLLAVVEACLKLQIACSYPLALCSVYTSSDILYARFTHIFIHNIAISSSPMIIYQLT